MNHRKVVNKLCPPRDQSQKNNSSPAAHSSCCSTCAGGLKLAVTFDSGLAHQKGHNYHKSVSRLGKIQKSFSVKSAHRDVQKKPEELIIKVVLEQCWLIISLLIQEEIILLCAVIRSLDQ